MSCKTIVLEGVATGTTAVVTSLTETHGVVRAVYVDADDLAATADIDLGWIHPDIDPDFGSQAARIRIWQGTNVGADFFVAYPHAGAVTINNAAMLYAGSGQPVPVPVATFGKLQLAIAECVAGDKFRVMVLVD